MTDSEKLEKALCILSSIAPSRVPGPFITGALGDMGTDGLHDAYMICPTYGADTRMTAIYCRSPDKEPNE